MYVFTFAVVIAISFTVTFGRDCTEIKDYYWRDYTSKWIPHDAIKGAEDRYIGQVYYNDKILPACIHKDEAIAEWVGKRVVTKRIKILCSPVPEKFYWENVNYNTTEDGNTAYLEKAVEGGYQENLVIYIGRAYHEGEWKIGKVLPKHIPTGGLQVWDKKGQCAVITEFEILKYISFCQ